MSNLLDLVSINTTGLVLNIINMAHASRAPKQWKLEKKETLNSYNNWKENLLYTLSLDANFTIFLSNPAFTWSKATSADPNRGLTDDADTVPQDRRRTKEQKVIQLNLMLGQIANFATVISRNTIVKNSTSLGDIWSKIREHFGFHITGSRFLDLTSIQLTTDERPEDLYQRLLTFFDDNLLTTDNHLTHHAVAVTANEEVTPTLENVIVLLWLERIHIGLPGLVQQRYGAELRNKTLASIKPEISQALNSLLEELKGSEQARIARNFPDRNFRRRSSSPPSARRKTKSCTLCRAAKRSGADTHFMSQCKHLPDDERKMMQQGSRVRIIDAFDESEGEEGDDDLETEDNSAFIDNPAPAVQRRVKTRKSPYMNCFYNEIPVVLCLDSGAESNLVSRRFARYARLDIGPTKQGAVQADEKTPLNTVGEVKSVVLTRGSHKFTLDALVTADDFGDVIGGEPFLEENDIAIRSARKQIIIRGRDIIPYAPSR